MSVSLSIRNRQLALGLCGVLMACIAGRVAHAAPVAGSVSRVTLYRGQALVTRDVPVAGKDGALELVVSDLPAQVVPDSLFAEGSDAVEVRAVRFRSRAVGEEPQQEIRKLDEALEDLNLKLAANRKSLELAARQASYLDQLDGFVAPTAKQDLSKGVLDAKALQEVTKFSFERREKIAERQLALDKEARTLTADLALLQRKRAEVAGKATRTVHEALLFLVKRGAADATVRVNYLVGGCGWAPAYTLHAGADRKQVEVQYSALIQQMTGESWDDVALTLSTASPAISARGPGLAPFHVVLGPAAPNAPGQSYSPSDLSSQVKGNNDRRNSAVQQAQQGYMLADEIGNAWVCNTVAMQIQNLELLGGRDIVRVLRTVDAEAPSISYRLKERVSLASRADQQTVRILQQNMPSKFYYVATPILSPYVYREAELANDSQEDLLAGPITVYLGDRFVGRGEIPTVTRGQTFVVGFGADPQMHTSRELADKKDDTQGGNRELAFQYRLVVENYSDEAVPVRLLDRVPHAENGADVRVSLGEMKDKLSDDQLYVRLERPKGILRWDIKVPAKATAEKAHVVNYGYKVEFDRKLQLASPEDSKGRIPEFEKLQRDRLKF